VAAVLYDKVSTKLNNRIT